MTVPVVLVCLAVAAAGLSLRRARSAIVAWFCTIAFAVAAAAPEHVGSESRDVVPQRVALRGDPAGWLAGATAAGPHGDDLVLELPAGSLPPLAGPLGARAQLAHRPLPFAPHEVQLRLLGAAAVDRPLLLEVRTPAVPDGRARGELVVECGGTVVHRTALALDGVVREVSFVPSVAGEHELRLEIECDGVQLGASAFVAVEPPRAVYVIEPTGLVAAALAAQGVRVERGAAPPAQWRDHGAVVLGAPLDAAAYAPLAEAVADGLGLFVLEPAFGDAGSPLRDLLPLVPEPEAPPAPGEGPGTAAAPPPPVPEPAAKPPTGDTEGAGPVTSEPVEVDKRLVAVALVVDRSGSMGNTLPNGHTKMSYARQSALRSAEALGPGDEVAVITFGNKHQGRVELPRTDASALETVRAGVARLTHGAEFTFLLSGLQRAAEQLAASKAAVRHIVVISDGEFDLSERMALRSFAHDLATRQRITLSVIAIVDPSTANEFRLEADALARDGGGRFLALDDAMLVPTFVTAEVAQSLASVGRQPGGQGAPAEPEPRREPPVETPPAPPPPEATPPTTAPARLTVHAIAASPLLAPAPVPDWPSLAAARPGEGRFEAEVLLAAGDAGWPLLAFANRGLGRVGAFAADLCGDACAEFRREPAFAARLAQWVTHCVAPAPTAAARSVLEAWTMAPVVATPDDVARFAELAGGEVESVVAPDAPRRDPVRHTQRMVPEWLLVVWLVALAAAERRAARRPATA